MGWGDLDGVAIKLQDINNVPFTEENGLTYLRGLAGEERAKAREYFERAPEEVVTPLRRAVGEWGWGA